MHKSRFSLDPIISIKGESLEDLNNIARGWEGLGSPVGDTEGHYSFSTYLTNIPTLLISFERSRDRRKILKEFDEKLLPYGQKLSKVNLGWRKPGYIRYKIVDRYLV